MQWMTSRMFQKVGVTKSVMLACIVDMFAKCIVILKIHFMKTMNVSSHVQESVYPKLCYETRPTCTVIVSKVIPGCDHIQEVMCYVDPADFSCKAPCSKKCIQGHPCPKLYYEMCPACRVKVSKVIPGCGHIQKVMCHINPAHFSCKAPCSKTCAEGHLCSKLCSEYCGECLTVAEKLHPSCGHLQNTYCYMDPVLCECYHPCEHTCHTNPSNPHRCKKLCYLPCGNCKEKVDKILPQCGHKQLVACYRDPQTHTCQAPCERKLPCGHPCTNKCGVPCTINCMVEEEKNFPNCIHTTRQPCSTSIDKVFC